MRAAERFHALTGARYGDGTELLLTGNRWRMRQRIWAAPLVMPTALALIGSDNQIFLAYRSPWSQFTFILSRVATDHAIARSWRNARAPIHK